MAHSLANRSATSGTARVLPGPHAPPPSPFAPLAPATPAKEKMRWAMPAAARLRFRHALLMASFLALVVLPTAFAGWYLFSRASDRFVAHLGFAVRAEGKASLSEGIPALAAFYGTSSNDSAILEEFLLSTSIVEKVGTRVPLLALWSAPTNDPLFALAPHAGLEDQAAYWRRMVRFSTRHGSGLIGVSVAAFSPEDAALIANAIRLESAALVNRLSQQAKEEALRSSREERERAAARLRDARTKMAGFRAESRIIDPSADVASEMGVLSDLQKRLAEETVTLALLQSDAESLRTARNGDVSAARIGQTQKRIAVLEARIAAEREKFGGVASRDYARILATFEAASVDLEFAEQAYVAALAAEEVARADARRQARYLAVYEEPIAPESSVAPRRGVMLGLIFGAALLLWSVLSLTAYGLRDRL